LSKTKAWRALFPAKGGLVKECSKINFRNSGTVIIKRFKLGTCHTTGRHHSSCKQHAESSLLEMINIKSTLPAYAENDSKCNHN